MNHTLSRQPPAHRRRLRDVPGFTILEVAMAASIMALGIATSIIVMQSGFKAVDLARDTTLASQILQSEMERLRLLPWDNPGTKAKDSIWELISEDPKTGDKVDLSTVFSSSAALAEKFKVTRTIVPDPDRSTSVLKITLSVTWPSYDGRTHTRSFQSMYAKNGLYDYYYTKAN